MKSAVPLTLAAALGPAGFLLLVLGVMYGTFSQAASLGGLLGIGAIITALIALPIGVYRLAKNVDRAADEVV